MNSSGHITAMPSAADLVEFDEAITKNNAANLAKRPGQYDEAIRLQTEAVQAKVRIHGERFIHAAISFNDLGETYLEAGKLDEAADAFAKALVVRDDKSFGGMELGPRNDAAASRDNVARVLEARGDFPGARELRLKGADRGHTMCGCEDCVFPGGAMLSRPRLKACGACRSVFYCSPACQKSDWTTRHKPLCKKYTASKLSAANPAGAGTSAGDRETHLVNSSFGWTRQFTYSTLVTGGIRKVVIPRRS